MAVRPPFLYANDVTHFAFVNVDCHEVACVHLYAPTYKKCWRAFVLATRLIAEQGGFHEGDEVEQFLRLGDHLAGQAEDAAGDEEFERQTKELLETLREKGPQEVERFDEKFETDE